MECEGYLTVSGSGSVRFTKTKMGLAWNEVSIKVQLDIPDELFQRPLITAKLTVDRSIVPEDHDMSLVLNTKELIEQSTGAKIEFKVIKEEEEQQ